MLKFGSAWTSFDFESHGKRSGHINLSHSDNEMAFSSVCVPVGVINGDLGPTVLLTAGNHGDEYEGQVILQQLMQTLSPSDIKGKLIMLPALNTPAVENRSRVSPLDNGNMNRSFPGSEQDGPTGQIAGFVTTQLVPMVDVILDFHSGGTATQYVDCGFLAVGPDSNMNKANLELARIFGAPYTMVCPIDGTGGDFDTAAHLRKTRFLACELGGLGRYSPTSFQIGMQATQRILVHLGIIEGDSTAPKTRFIDLGENSAQITARHRGLAQLHVNLGQDVSKCEHLATIYDIHNFGTVLSELRSDRDGVVAICRRNPLVQPGDKLFEIAPDALAQDLV